VLTLKQTAMQKVIAVTTIIKSSAIQKHIVGFWILI